VWGVVGGWRGWQGKGNRVKRQNVSDCNVVRQLQIAGIASQENVCQATRHSGRGNASHEGSVTAPCRG